MTTQANRIDPRTLSEEARRRARQPDFDAPEDRVRLQAERAHEKVRGDDSLTAKAKTQAHARIERDARAQMRDFEKRAGAERDAQLQSARRKAFGVDDLVGSGDGVALRSSHRSALDRADAIDDPRIGASTLARAQDVGDEVMCRALAHRAFSKGWTDVLSTYTAARPEAAKAIETLTTEAPMTGAALFRYALPSAPELVSKVTRSQANDHQLEALAAGEDVQGFSS